MTGLIILGVVAVLAAFILLCVFLPAVGLTILGIIVLLTGAALCTAAHLEELDDTVRSLIRQVGEALYSGRAARTPGEDACRFCTMRSGCPVAERIRKL